MKRGWGGKESTLAFLTRTLFPSWALHPHDLVTTPPPTSRLYTWNIRIQYMNFEGTHSVHSIPS